MPKIELIQGDCLIEMKNIFDEDIDLTVTSPPYDNLRTYNNNILWDEHVWKPVIKDLYRVTKKGGVAVWIVSDATINGSETGTSFRQALWAKKCGFNLHDTMIYSKGGKGANGSIYAYWQDFEYMFVWSKGKPKTLNFIEDRKNKKAPGKKLESQGHRNQDGTKKEKRVIKRKEFGRRFNIWQYHECGTRTNHPAVFPYQLAHDHIVSWSNEGDKVLDPFMGSNTTGLACKKLNRNFIGIELDPEYFKMAKDRVSKKLQIELFQNVKQ